VDAIELHIDSPGGDVSGCHELWARLRACAKPLTARVDGMCASAAYWLASACDRVEATATSAVGSVGVYTVVPPERPGEVVVTSSLTPRKTARPPEDDAVQALVDDMAAIMLADIALGNGIAGSVESIATELGSGAIMSASAALRAGRSEERRVGKECPM
jgi:enoyl-CoA hydratase/carnithine racemase